MLRLNHVQVLGTHNSYHVQGKPAVFAALQAFDAGLAATLEYTHRPLVEQFEQLGVRQIEIDVFADPEGGRYADPAGARLVGQPEPRLPELEQPGLKVLHVQDIDYRTRCLTFVACLEELRDWSDGHPGHVPIMVEVEAKDDEIPDPLDLGFVVPIRFDAAQLDEIDREIRATLPPDKLITPDDVRGTHATLEEAITTDGWPTLGETRGRILFTLDNEDDKKTSYLAGHPSLAGRVLFVSARPGSPEAAFVKLNDPIDDGELIHQVVAAGYIVRTRADGDTVQARSGDVSQREAALASGAQFVSTDYPEPDPRFGTGYFVAIPGGTPARCNPVSAPADCTSLDVENPDALRAE
ncbi:MAG TPA: phosphatidylinositol-specific phospholipase C1-like protein [Candidatus Binatia bacterium]|nr:phosphatidylinositol-specific phospholipase C1-like protein [Candidatus Binatia bacterium]